MDSTSTAGDFSTAEIPRMSSAASLEPAKLHVQATEIPSQPVQHGADGEESQTGVFVKQELARDSPEATTAGAQTDIKEDTHLPIVDTSDDDCSLDSSDLEDVKVRQPMDLKTPHLPSLLFKYKESGPKYARAASIHPECLEARVGELEKELLELQYDVGSKERPDEVKSHYDKSRPDAPCAEPLPLKTMLLSLIDWKKGNFYVPNKYNKAAMFLATTTETSSFQLESIHINTDKQGMIHRNRDHGLDHDNHSHKTDDRPPETSVIARLYFRSPWPFVLIELLSGERVSTVDSWIYPFKHFIVFEKQIREIIALLSEIDVDDVEAKDLFQTLSRVVREAVHTLGPKRDDVEMSEAYVSNVLQRYGSLRHHHSKVRKSSPEEQGEELEDNIEAEKGPSSMSQVAGPIPEVSESSKLASEALPKQVRYRCTCLKDAKNHLLLLIQAMDLHLRSLITLHKAIRDRAVSKIRFEDLWHLFQPGDLVVTSKQPYQAYRVLHVSGGRPLLTTTDVTSSEKDHEAEPTSYRSQVSPFTVDCVRFDYDGEKFGPVQDSISIFKYEEDRMITKLDMYPMSYAEKSDELTKTLLNRGRRFAEYKGFQHKRYEGLSLGEPQEEIDSEVIIDFTQSFRQTDYAKFKPQIGIQGATRADVREVYQDRCPADEEETQCGKLDHNSLVDDTEFDRRQMDRFLNDESRGIFLESGGDSQILTEDQLILLPYRVQGFSLRSRKWLPLNIDLLQDINEYDSLEGQNSGFDDLVIPDEYKRIVKALVKSHALGSRPTGNRVTERQQIDIIRGKGKGLIILLHGVPGVGKTSTAESVASYTGRPLFPITCGDIGQTAPDVERNLESIFLLARRWGCVLLLDEADVFLAKREKGGDGIDRNALVSVFLRTLEYYSGILFLTTNRIGSFDEAFKSRIHISLYYAPLSERQTFDVWTMNLNRLSKSNRDIYVDKSDIETFAKDHWKDGKRWNGRQIRNAFQTAVALAEYEFQEKCEKCEKTGDKPPFKPVLEDKHFKAVAQTSAEFDDYLQSVMGGQTHEQKAQISEMRADTYDPERGMETPSGKKYNNHRAVRPTRPSEQPPPRQSESLGKQTATPPATPQLSTTSSAAGHGASVDEEEEYRQWKAELEKQEEQEQEKQEKQEKQKQAEKMERFRKMREREQMGK